MDIIMKLYFVVTMVFLLIVQLKAVTVNQSLCPTNKVAPYRRSASWEQSRPRTLGLIYGLFTPGRPRPLPVNNLDELQEQPQEDDPDDCGEIEDYDETDLSSITPGGHNKVNNNRRNRFLFGDNNSPDNYYPAANRPGKPPYQPTTIRPHRPTYPPTKPPFHSGGIFASNVYRPQNQHHPSNYIKPVHENIYDNPQATYNPGLVGGALGHVVGYQPVRPTYADERVTTLKPNSHIRFPDRDIFKNKHSRADQVNVASGIVGSFVDLLFH